MLQVKLYTSSGTLTRIISPKELMGGISWSSQIDGGQGNVSIRLNLPISTQITGDIVKIYSVDEYRPSGGIVYTGWISKIEREIDNAEYITLNCLGLGSLMSQVIASQVNRNGTISSIVEGIIDEMNTKYPYYTNSVQSVSTSLNIAPEYMSLYDLMDSVKYDGYHWRIGGDGVMKWGNTWTTHHLTLGRNISNLNVTTDLEKIVNRVYVKYGGGVHMVEDTDYIERNSVGNLKRIIPEIRSRAHYIERNSVGNLKQLESSRSLEDYYIERNSVGNLKLCDSHFLICMIISNGTLLATGNDSLAGNTRELIISNGTLLATGNELQDRDIGGLIISNGTLLATGNELGVI